jgi:uncharacterized membrane protein
MIPAYHRFAGQSLERIGALSDGIFAVAMTLLVLNLHVPIAAVFQRQQPMWAGGAIQSEQALWNALAQLAPQLLTYFMSFLTLGIFWVGQQTQFNLFAQSNHRLTWIHLLFLLTVVLMPFSTNILAEYITFRLALLMYWVNLFLLGALLFVSISYASRAGLLKPDVTPAVLAASRRRIFVYQSLYAVACLLCVINTYLSIGCLVVLQVNSVVAPPIGRLNRF